MIYNSLVLAVAISLYGCSSNIGSLITGTQSGASEDANSSCHQQARNNVRQNWQKVGRDWIKHEEYRQYTICADKLKNNNS